jgi:gas vesicle protein
MRKCEVLISAAVIFGGIATIDPAVACGGVFEGACDLGRTIEKGARETGSAVKTDAYDLGNAIDRGAKETGKAVKTGADDAGNALQKGAEETGHAVKTGVHDAGNAIQNGEQDSGNPTVASPVVPSTQP